MTNNPTIDGVSRELLSDLVKLASRNVKSAWSGGICGRAQALLDAPAVERQEPSGYVGLNALGGLRGSDGYLMMAAKPERYLDIPVYRETPEVAALQSTIDQLQARVQELESGRGEVIGTLKREGETIVFDVVGDPHIRDGMQIFKAPGAMVLPGRKPQRITDAFAEGWNACLDATAALNGVRK